MSNSVLDEKVAVTDRFAVSNHRSAALSALREKGQAALDHLDVPTTRMEYWKYTRTASWLKPAYNTTPAPAAAEESLPHTSGLDCYRLVFVNGQVDEQRSILPGDGAVTISTIAEAKGDLAHLGQLTNPQDHYYLALNAATANDGAVVHVAKKGEMNKPLHIIELTTGHQQASSRRNLIVVEDQAAASIIHHQAHQASEGSFATAVTEIFIGEAANGNYLLVQEEGESNGLINHTYVHQKRNSQFTINTITFSGKLVRNNLNILVDGTNCETTLNGLYMARGKQLVDNHTLVDHLQPHCNSSESYKGIMNEQSTGVFNGKVFVRQDAQKTNAFQSNQNILLTDEATINSKPELEIYADDVKCSHGSTTGQFDEEAVFYLRARGLSEQSARKLLIKAFAADVLDSISFGPVREQIEQNISDRYDNVLAS